MEGSGYSPIRITDGISRHLKKLAKIYQKRPVARHVMSNFELIEFVDSFVVCVMEMCSKM